MDYRAITSTTSAQYQLIHSGMIAFGNDGLLYYGDYVGAALGSKYTDRIGDLFIATLDSGEEMKLVSLDMKSDSHTINGCHHAKDGSVVELVIDTELSKQFYPNAINMGSFNTEDKFSGNIIKVRKVGNVYD